MYKSYLKSIKPSRKVLFSFSSSVFVDYSTSMMTNESTIAAGGTELGPRGRLIVKLCFINHSILPINQNHCYFLPFKCINKGVLLQNVQETNLYERRRTSKSRRTHPLPRPIGEAENPLYSKSVVKELKEIYKKAVS